MASWFGARPELPPGEAAIDLALIAAWAEGRCDGETLDRLARALGEWPELADVPWTYVEAQAEALSEDAPLFSEARKRVVLALRRHPSAPAAMTLASRLVGPGASDARILLSDVARQLGQKLPDPLPELPTFHRARFDDPELSDDLPFHTALGLATGEERRLLTFKLVAARRSLYRIGPRARVVRLGARWPSQGVLHRVDAELEALSGRYLCRFLADGEALHPAELRALPRLVDDLRLGERFLLAYERRLAPQDLDLSQSLAPDRSKCFDVTELQ